MPRRAAGICQGIIGPIPFRQASDFNGNLTTDPDAGLSGMTYNALNLLSGYTETGSGYQTTIEYSASGENYFVYFPNTKAFYQVLEEAVGRVVSPYFERYRR